LGQNVHAYVIGILVASIALTVIALIKKEGAGSQALKENLEVSDEQFKINYLYALIPILPIVLLVISSKQIAWIPYMDVPQSMVLVSVLSLLITRVNYIEFTKKFFKGNGDAFCDVIGLLAAAAMFIQGMQVIGLTGALIDAMKTSDAIAKVASAFGPFIIAAVSGSGVAATLAFNGSVTPHAAQFGLTVVDVGSMAQAAGQVGRAMSPVAGATIILAKFAGVNPIEVAKRNALPTILATIAMMFAIF
jgi:DcuC family C4-dicarboxylate transporter